MLRAVVANASGVHARPSHAIVSAAQDFDAEIELHCRGRRAAARSILAVMTLGAECGAEIEVRATGPDAAAAAQKIVELLSAVEPA